MRLVCDRHRGFPGVSGRQWAFPGKVTMLIFLMVAPVWGQQGTDEQGIESGNYNIRQSVEFGYRFTDFTGNQAT
jgi:hypothetical protein